MNRKTSPPPFVRLLVVAVFITIVLFNTKAVRAQDTCGYVGVEASGVLPPPPLEEHCEDEEGHTIFYQFRNINLGSFCDMGAVGQGHTQSGEPIDYSEMRLWDYMEALLDACARDTLCNGGYYNTGQQAITLPFSFFQVVPNFQQPPTQIDVFNQAFNSGGVYNGGDMDHFFDRFKWTANYGKTILPDPTGMCTGNFCGRWLIDDFELHGSNKMNMEVTYKLACCPCEDQGGSGTELPGDDQIGTGNN